MATRRPSSSSSSSHESSDRSYRYLTIQREAVGFYDHRAVDRLYRLRDPLD